MSTPGGPDPTPRRGGAGATGILQTGAAGETNAGAGGDSNDWAEAGDNGVAGNVSAGGAGGAAGNAIRLIDGAIITWVGDHSSTHIKGAVS